MSYILTGRKSIMVGVAVVALAITSACGHSAATPVAKSISTPPAAVPTRVPTTPTTPTGPATPTTPASTARPTATGTPGRFVFPVVGHYAYGHTHHDYPATDILTNCGNEVRAATSGVILEVNRVDRYKPKVNAGATRGGLSVSIKGDDGVRYYGSHLEEINQNIQPGVRVAMGEMLGKVGRTGDASACHLHFGISPICSGTGDWWIQRGVLYPWPYLDSWRKGGEKSPVAAVAAWQKQHGCPTKPLTDP